MKTLYIECAMGAAGDMLMAALLELIPSPDAFLEKLNSLNIPRTRVERKLSTKCGIQGTHVAVTVGGVEEESLDVQGHPYGHDHDHVHDHAHPHEHDHDPGYDQDHDHNHNHSGVDDIGRVVDALNVPACVRTDAKEVYALLASAEAHVHGVPVEQVHLHEVGAMDAVADIVGVAMLMEELMPDEVVFSPINVGFGQVRCAHGVLPVPAPATARLLIGIPTYAGSVRGELCTPTGAALIRHFATGFGPMPSMTVSAIGYGMGRKDFEAANCVRAFLGERCEGDGSDEIVMLQCNLDDMTGEAIGFTFETLMAGGALDVFITPVQMKKKPAGPPALLHVHARTCGSDGGTDPEAHDYFRCP